MKEFKGDEFLYLVEVEDNDRRFFNQTDGSSSIESDSIDLNTKDRTGSDYGSITESVSLEGVLTEGDPAIRFVKKQLRGKKLIKITELNTRTLEAESGMYMISSFEQTNSVGEFATYSLDAELNGSIKESELEEVPEGAGDDYEGGFDDEDEGDSDSGE